MQIHANRRPYVFLSALLVLATGCSQPLVGGAKPTMRLGMFSPDAPQPIIKVNPQAKPGTTSELTITVRADSLLARRLLATVADVERVEVHVTAADGSTFTATVTKAQLSAGTVSVTFPAVPVGTANVTLTAYDIDNKVIGTATRSTTVVAGTTTPVNVPLTLHGQPASSGGSGGGSNPTPTTGGVAVNGSIHNGPTLPEGVLAWFDVPLIFNDFLVDASGFPWAAGNLHTTGDGVVYGYDENGTVVKSVSQNAELTGMGLDGAGHLYTQALYVSATGTSNMTSRYLLSDLSAPPVTVATSTNYYRSVDSGSGGHVWAGYQLVTALPQVVKFNALSHVFQHEFGETPVIGVSHVDAGGNLWLPDLTGLARVSTDGTHTLIPTTLDRPYVVTEDVNGDIWVAGRIGSIPEPFGDDMVDPQAPTDGKVYAVHLKPDGTFVKKVEIGNQAVLGLYVDPTGVIYASFPIANQVVKYAADGTPLKTYSVPFAGRMGFGGGKLWVQSEGPHEVHGLMRLAL